MRMGESRQRKMCRETNRILFEEQTCAIQKGIEREREGEKRKTSMLGFHIDSGEKEREKILVDSDVK